MNRKSSWNSAHKFFDILFKVKNKNDEEIHDSRSDEISFLEMKSYYEKYCYLNALYEKDIEDKDNIVWLNKRGFTLVYRNDATTQYYTFISLHEDVKREMPRVSVTDIT